MLSVLGKAQLIWKFNKMKPEQSVLNKLAKFSTKEVELSVQEPIEVEFALIDDVKSTISQAESLMQEIDKDGKEFLRLERVINTKGNLLITKIYDSLDSSVNKLERSSKELGVAIPEISKIQKVLNDIRGIRKTYGF